MGTRVTAPAAFLRSAVICTAAAGAAMVSDKVRAVAGSSGPGIRIGLQGDERHVLASLDRERDGRQDASSTPGAPADQGSAQDAPQRTAERLAGVWR